MKRLAGLTAVVLVTLLVLIILWQLRFIVAIFLLSLAAAATVRPVVDRLASLRLPRGPAQLLVYLSAFATLALALLLVGGPLFDELQVLTNRVFIGYTDLYRTYSAAGGWQTALAARLPAPDQLIDGGGTAVAQPALRILFGATRNLAILVSGLFSTLVLSIYWSADQNHFERLWLSLLPAGNRSTARAAWRHTEEAVGAYIRSEFAQALLAAILLGAGYSLIGLDYPLILAVIGAFSWLVPLVGVLFISLAAFFVGLMESFQVALLAVALTVAVLAALEFFVEPRLFDRRRYSSFLTVLLALPLAQVLGLTGLLVAPPLTVMLQEGVGQFLQLRGHATASAIEEVSELKERYEVLHERFQGDIGAEEAPAVASFLTRLKALIDEAGRTRST